MGVLHENKKEEVIALLKEWYRGGANIDDSFILQMAFEECDTSSKEFSSEINEIVRRAKR